MKILIAHGSDIELQDNVFIFLYLFLFIVCSVGFFVKNFFFLLRMDRLLFTNLFIGVLRKVLEKL